MVVLALGAKETLQLRRELDRMNAGHFAGERGRGGMARRAPGVVGHQEDRRTGTDGTGDGFAHLMQRGELDELLTGDDRVHRARRCRRR